MRASLSALVFVASLPWGAGFRSVGMFRTMAPRLRPVVLRRARWSHRRAKEREKFKASVQCNTR
jgi:hypothetical protein